MSSCSSKNPQNTCPVKMSDGRSMTDYRPKCMVNYEILNNLTNNNISYINDDGRIIYTNDDQPL